MNNLNLIFNKLYYRKLGEEVFESDIKNWNKVIYSSDFFHNRDYEASPVANSTFLLKTTYPGFISGMAISHSSGQSEHEIDSGFCFDYVTGQPYIAASGVKGVLRSAFSEKTLAVAEILSGITDRNWTQTDINSLENEIFCGNDIFLDAVIYDSDMRGLVISPDFITPQPDPLKGPSPMALLKIVPGVRFEFRFLLSNGTIGIPPQQPRRNSLFANHYG